MKNSVTAEDRKKLSEFALSSGRLANGPKVRVETRPLCGGNLLRQPFLSGRFGEPSLFPNADYLHFHGFYMGNNHLITDDEIETPENLPDDFFEKI